MKLGLLAITMLSFLAIPPAWAGDDGETLVMVKDTIEDIAKARKTKDEDLMGASFVRLVELHNGLEGDTPRKKLQAAVGGVLRDKKCRQFHSEAISTLEALDDGDGVYKQLGAALPKANATEVADMNVYAVKVVGTVGSPKGLSYLAGLTLKGKHLPTRVAAAEALGKYRPVEKSRVKALGHLFTLLHAVRPKEDKPQDDAAKKVWAALEKPIVTALDELTYKDLGSSAAWVEWHKANKSKLKKVFKD